MTKFPAELSGGNHAFGSEKIVASELYIALDSNFHPLEESQERTPEYEGTLDLVLLDSLTEAEIND